MSDLIRRADAVAERAHAGQRSGEDVLENRTGLPPERARLAQRYDRALALLSAVPRQDIAP